MANKLNTRYLFTLIADYPFLSRLVVFLFGCASTLVFAPASLAILAAVFILPLLFIAMAVSPRQTAGYYFWFGLGLFLAGTYWIYISVHGFGNAPLWVALVLMVGLALILATLVSIAGWLTGHFAQGEPWRLMLAGPAAWVFIEWLRGWILTGFPWLAQGYGQIDTPLAGWAPLLGVYGVSLMLLLSTTALLVAFFTPGRERLIATVAVFLPWLLGGILSFIDWTEPYGDPIKTTIIQGGISQDQKWLPEQRQATLALYRDATLQVPDSELVVWPEVAIPARDDQVQDYLDIIDNDARRNGQTVLTGILEYNGDRRGQPRISNSVFSLGTDKRQIYRKRHLVPFGEYFPVPERVREWMRLQNLPHTDLTAGDEEQPLLIAANGAKLAVAICYEDAYGAEQLYAFPDADVLINVSNDAWFGDSIAPHQHLQIARMRALEVGRYAVRSTNTGISAFIAPDGELLQTSKQFETQAMTADIHAHSGTTLYADVGNWPVLLYCFGVFGFFYFRSRAGI